MIHQRPSYKLFGSNGDFLTIQIEMQYFIKMRVLYAVNNFRLVDEGHILFFFHIFRVLLNIAVEAHVYLKYGAMKSNIFNHSTL